MLRLGQRVRLSNAGLLHMRRVSRIYATVVGFSVEPGLIRIVRDGTVTPQRYSARFWEPIEGPVELGLEHAELGEWWRITDAQVTAFQRSKACVGDLRIECVIALGEHPVLRSPVAKRRARKLIAAAIWALREAA